MIIIYISIAKENYEEPYLNVNERHRIDRQSKHLRLSTWEESKNLVIRSKMSTHLLTFKSYQNNQIIKTQTGAVNEHHWKLTAHKKEN